MCVSLCVWEREGERRGGGGGGRRRDRKDLAELEQLVEKMCNEQVTQVMERWGVWLKERKPRVEHYFMSKKRSVLHEHESFETLQGKLQNTSGKSCRKRETPREKTNFWYVASLWLLGQFSSVREKIDPELLASPRDTTGFITCRGLIGLAGEDVKAFTRRMQTYRNWF